MTFEIWKHLCLLFPVRSANINSSVSKIWPALPKSLIGYCKPNTVVSQIKFSVIVSNKWSTKRPLIVTWTKGSDKCWEAHCNTQMCHLWTENISANVNINDRMANPNYFILFRISVTNCKMQIYVFVHASESYQCITKVVSS